LQASSQPFEVVECFNYWFSSDDGIDFDYSIGTDTDRRQMDGATGMILDRAETWKLKTQYNIVMFN